MSSSTEQTARGAEQTATSTSQLASGAQEISKNVDEGAGHINKLNKVIQEISEEAKIISNLEMIQKINANAGSQHEKMPLSKLTVLRLF